MNAYSISEKAICLIFLLFSIVMTSVWNCYGVYHFPKVFSLEAYFLLLFNTTGLLTIYSSYSILKNKIDKSSNYYIILSSIICFSCFYFFIGRFIADSPIWLDEYTQFMKGSYQKFYSPIISASQEQQPPIDYLLAFGAHKIFGNSALAVKLGVLINSSLFFIILPFLAYQYSKSIQASSVVSVLSLLLLPFIKYSSEARPTFLTLLTACFVLSFLKTYIDHKSRSSLVLFFSSSVIFSFTIGLQPPIALLLVGGSSLVFIKGLGKKNFASLFGALVATGILYVPFIFNVISESIKLNKFESTKAFSLKTFFYHLDTNIIELMFEGDIFITKILVFLLFLGVLESIFRKIVGKKEDRNDLLFVFMTLLTVLFPLVVFTVFNYKIAWVFHYRYFILFYLFLVLSSSLALKNLLHYFKKTHIQWFASFFLFCISFYQFSKGMNYVRYALNSKAEWKPIYSIINKQVTDQDRIMRLDFVRLGRWRPNLFVAKEIYTKEDVQDVFYKNTVRDAGLENGLTFSTATIRTDKANGYLYFINSDERNSSFILLEDTGYKALEFVKRSRGLALYRLPIKGNVFLTLEHFLLFMIENHSSKDHVGVAFEALARMYLEDGQLTKVNFILNKYQSIDYPYGDDSFPSMSNKNELKNRHIQEIRKKMKAGS